MTDLDFETLGQQGQVETRSDPPPISSAIEKLSRELEQEKDGRKEDRFIFALAVTIGFNVFVFQAIDNWAGILAIFLLELVALLVLARRYGIDEMHVLLDKLRDTYTKSRTEN